MITMGGFSLPSRTIRDDLRFDRRHHSAARLREGSVASRTSPG
jgi:hypothetical protein